jgi:uncharacterized protein (DUF1501 family)
MNAVIPYTNPLYPGHRPNLGIPEEEVLRINGDLGFHPAMAPIMRFWDEGKIAIIGVGYRQPIRSH